MRFILLFTIMIFTADLQAQGPVLIELFTSQGCSSCPAADKNLSEIIQKAEKDGKPVFGLSFHVDYWNYIGWKDPYSRREFTDRQQRYSETLGLESIYTPQMIVNGKVEFVGSSKTGAEKAIGEAQKQKPMYQISISNVIVSDNQVSLQYSLDKDPVGEILNLAVVERDVENYVPRGENSGKKLHHDNVVKAFKTIPLQRQGHLELTIPPVNSAKASMIVFIQDKQWRVLTSLGRTFGKAD